jgi:hypothetical protein
LRSLRLRDKCFGVTKPDPIDALINEEALNFHGLMTQRQALDRDIEISRARLQAFHKAKAALSNQPAADPVPEKAETAAPNGDARPTIIHPDPWQDALIAMKARGGEFTTDEIMAEAKRRGSDIMRVRVRSRLAHLVDKKVLLRVREGVFRFSPQGGEFPDSGEWMLDAARKLAWRDDETPDKD